MLRKLCFKKAKPNELIEYPNYSACVDLNNTKLQPIYDE